MLSLSRNVHRSLYAVSARILETNSYQVIRDHNQTFLLVKEKCRPETPNFILYRYYFCQPVIYVCSSFCQCSLIKSTLMVEFLYWIYSRQSVLAKELSCKQGVSSRPRQRVQVATCGGYTGVNCVWSFLNFSAGWQSQRELIGYLMLLLICQILILFMCTEIIRYTSSTISFSNCWVIVIICFGLSNTDNPIFL